FCPVCTQAYALTFFGHPRVQPTAPIESSSPASPVATTVGTPTDFSAVTRLALAPATATYSWIMKGPGYPPAGTEVSTAAPPYTASFTQTGAFTLTLTVVADANLIKPAKNG